MLSVLVTVREIDVDEKHPEDSRESTSPSRPKLKEPFLRNSHAGECDAILTLRQVSRRFCSGSPAPWRIGFAYAHAYPYACGTLGFPTATTGLGPLRQ